MFLNGRVVTREDIAVRRPLVMGLMLATVLNGCATYWQRDTSEHERPGSPWNPELHGSMPSRDSGRGGYWWQPSLDESQPTGNKGVVYSRGPVRRRRVREAVAFAGPPVETPVVEHGYRIVERIVLDHMMYDYDKAVLKPEGKKEVARAAKYLADHPEVTAVIEGHTDWIASEKYNMALGRRRANTVKDALVANGVSVERMTVISYGESRPVADNKTDEGRALNRRAVINLVVPDDSNGSGTR